MDLYPTTPLHYKGRGRVDVPSALCVNTYFYSSRTVCGIRHRAGGLCLDVGTQMRRPDFTTRRNVCVCTLSVCLSVCLSLCLCLSVCLSVCLSLSACLCLSLPSHFLSHAVCMPVYKSLYWSVGQSVSVRLSLFLCCFFVCLFFVLFFLFFFSLFPFVSIVAHGRCTISNSSSS